MKEAFETPGVPNNAAEKEAIPIAFSRDNKDGQLLGIPLKLKVKISPSRALNRKKGSSRESQLSFLPARFRNHYIYTCVIIYIGRKRVYIDRSGPRAPRVRREKVIDVIHSSVWKK